MEPAGKERPRVPRESVAAAESVTTGKSITSGKPITTGKTIAMGKWGTAVKFALPAVIIAYLVWRIEPEKWQQLSEQPKNYGLLVAAIAAGLVAMSLSFTRWCLLVRCQNIQLSLLEAFRLGAICFLLSFISVGSVGGDLFKAIFLAKRRPGKRVGAIASVLVDRGCGLYGLLLLVAAGLILSPTDAGVGPSGDANVSGAAASGLGIAQIKWATAILIGMGTVVLATLIMGGRGVDRLITRGGQLPVVGKLVLAVGPPLRMFHDHRLGFCTAILISIGVQGMLVISMYLVARGLYAGPPTLGEHFIIVPIGMLASALPLTPAGLGLLEAAIDELYKIVPAVPTAASGILVALVFEMVKVVMAIIGTVFYWTANDEVRQTIQKAESEAQP